MKDELSLTTDESFHSLPETRWDRVLALRDPAERDAALAEICAAYGGVILARCRDWNPQEGQDLAQAFFEWVIEERKLEKADPKRGRFRGFLSVLLRNFLRKDYRTLQAQKRGGGVDHVELGAELDEELLRSYEAEDAAFDHEWAKAVMGTVINTLQAEAEGSGIKEEVLRELIPFLRIEDEKEFSRKSLAKRLGKPEGTVRSDVSKLSRRYRELLEREVAATTSGSDLQEEIRHLMRALARKP